MPSLSFQEQGTGPSIIFLHGFCETREIWKDFVMPFTKQYNVVLPDLPGFGGSEMLPAPFTIDQVGDAVAEWMINNKLNKSMVIGHSLGGYVTLSLAERHPELLAGYGLFHSTVFADSEEKKQNRNKVIEFVKKNGVQSFIDTFTESLFFDKKNAAVAFAYAIASTTSSQAVLEYSGVMRDRPDRSSTWIKTGMVRFLIAGEKDTAVPIEISRKIAEIGIDIEFCELENTAHMGFFESKTRSQDFITRIAYQVFLNK